MSHAMTAALQRIIREVSDLSPSEREELRSLLAPPEGERDYHRRLLEAGLTAKIPSGAALASRREPIAVSGKPLSESLLEERS